MNALKISFFTLACFVLYCCNNNKAVKAPKTADGEGEKAVLSFGDKIDEEGSITYDALLAKLETEEEVTTKVAGKISGVCQAKGCWMTIVSEENQEAEEMFVKFKDYAFFVPKDCTGKTAIMEGRAYKEETSVEELRHYAEDEGKSEEEIAAITEPVVELKFMASGVLLK